MPATKERPMQATEARQLITYESAMKLANMPRRTFYRRLASGVVPIYIDPADRRRRWLDRRDVLKLVQDQEVERSGETAA